MVCFGEVGSIKEWQGAEKELSDVGVFVQEAKSMNVAFCLKTGIDD